MFARGISGYILVTSNKEPIKQSGNTMIYPWCRIPLLVQDNWIKITDQDYIETYLKFRMLLCLKHI